MISSLQDKEKSFSHRKMWKQNCANSAFKEQVNLNKYIRKNSKKMTSYAVRKNNHSILSQFPVKIVFTWMIFLAVILSLQSMFQLKSVTFYSSIPGLVLIFFLYMFRSI